MPSIQAQRKSLQSTMCAAVVVLAWGVLVTLHGYLLTHFPYTGGGEKPDLRVLLAALLAMCEIVYSGAIVMVLCEHERLICYAAGGFIALLIGAILLFIFGGATTWLSFSLVIFASFWFGFHIELIAGPIESVAALCCVNRPMRTSTINSKDGHELHYIVQDA
ncbi:hypothetical protein PG996_006897 [Apiospora saccharicola]|uniref:Uncharacterized protein n=1 Tax=Apiospora saccharicola TaxID=335842 RepID=A0ABR1V9A7_9PEZI